MTYNYYVLDFDISVDLRYVEVPTPLPCAGGVPSDACPIGDFMSYVRSINAAEPYSTGALLSNDKLVWYESGNFRKLSINLGLLCKAA